METPGACGKTTPPLLLALFADSFGADLESSSFPWYSLRFAPCFMHK